MNWPKLPNREKITNELTRRYEEVLRKAEKGIHEEEEAQQFISLLAHYVYYVKKTPVTQKAVQGLFAHEDVVDTDKLLITEADKIIVQMKVDRNKIVRYARRKNINVDAYQFREGVHQFSPEESLSFHLHFLDQFLNLPGDQQQVSDVPKRIGDLLSVNFETQSIGGASRALTTMRQQYITTQDEFAKKLKLQGVYIDYLRIEDYKAIELVWREVYQEGERDERILFHLEYGDLFEKHRNYNQQQQQKADELVSKHVTHLQRVHNYLIDKLEDVPAYEKFLHWTVEHFGPTLLSLLLILLIYLFLHWIGVNISIDKIKSLTGL